MSDEILNGGCRCGKIRYEIRGDKFFNAACACRNCQQTSGAHVIQHLGGRLEKFALQSGKEFVKGHI